MINQRSAFLVILIATYNRLDLLKKTVCSIIRETQCPHEIIAIDGGSTDGTKEYIKSDTNITPVFQGELLGTARSYNNVWRQINSKYTCWLSDDTEIVNNSIDMAIDILEKNGDIGMVGLKMKDVSGPFIDRTYLGGISEYGILNCNHGVLSTALLRQVGYFNEQYRSYHIDPDLTASILCTGKKVAMTKKIGVLHHRDWADKEDVNKKIKKDMGGIDNQKIYLEKFKFLKESTAKKLYNRFFLHKILYILFYLYFRNDLNMSLLGFNYRDWQNLLLARFISIKEIFRSEEISYHLTQCIPPRLLKQYLNQ